MENFILDDEILFVLCLFQTEWVAKIAKAMAAKLAALIEKSGSWNSTVSIIASVLYPWKMMQDVLELLRKNICEVEAYAETAPSS